MGQGINAPVDIPGLVLVLAALFEAIIWNLITWYLGLPSSSTHALIGAVHWSEIVEKVIVSMVVSPVVGSHSPARS